MFCQLILSISKTEFLFTLISQFENLYCLKTTKCLIIVFVGTTLWNYPILSENVSIAKNSDIGRMIVQIVTTVVVPFDTGLLPSDIRLTHPVVLMNTIEAVHFGSINASIRIGTIGPMTVLNGEKGAMIEITTDTEVTSGATTLMTQVTWTNLIKNIGKTAKNAKIKSSQPRSPS